MSEATACFNRLYQDDRYALRYPSECVVRFLAGHRTLCRGRVLDIGCGTGRHLKASFEMGFEAVGLDSSRAGLDQAEKWLKNFGFFPRLHVGEAQKLPFADESFDLAIAYASLYYGSRADMRAAIDEIHRVLRPGGSALVVLRSADDWRAEICPADRGLGTHDEFGNAIMLISWPEMGELFEAFRDGPGVSTDAESFSIDGKLNSNWIFTARKGP